MDRDHVVEITYRDGQVLRTLCLTFDHANQHRDTVIRYPSVAGARVLPATNDDRKK